MSEAKDPAIKLFGKTIQLPDTPAAAAAAVASESGGDVSAQSNDVSIDDGSVQERPCSPNSLPAESNLDISGAEEESEKDLSGEKADVNEKEDGTESMMPEELTNSNSSSLTKENSKTPTVDTEAAPADATKAEDEENETSNSQDKTLKKPDKILPCPRCSSMDTKFCYYNNYNVNQPRHFCKNCQRYWTAGGTMRNVPVGAGRRKNKSSALQYKSMAVSETLQNSRPDLPSGIQHPSLKPNGSILAFGSGSPLCESMAAVLNIAEKTTHDHSRNGFHRPQELRIPVPYGTGGNGDDQLNGSSVTTSSSKDQAGKNGLPDKLIPNCQNIPPQVPCFPGAPWAYPWNSVQWSSPIPATAFCPPGFPMPFYPAAPYWGCTVPGTWNVPWLNPPPASQNLNSPTSGPNSPTLGKHSRDDNIMEPENNTKEEPPKESNPEKCLWVPKTLRIDDPEEAAKSSIWATLGIKNDKVDSVGDIGLFKAFQSKGDGKMHVQETSTVLQANPAALSRSLSFHERT